MQISVKSLSETTLHPDYRWDSEYLCYDPYKNKNLNYVPINNVLISSQYGLSVEMNEECNGTRIYRMDEINNMICARNILKYAQISHEEIENYKLKDKDILFNRTNSQAFVGRTGMFRKFSDENLVFASYLIRITPDPDIVSPEYLTAFLNTKYGILDVKRRARISINQSNVNAEELKRVEIPLVSSDFQLEITKAFDSAFKNVQASERKYQEAHTLLLSELGLLDWKPKHRLTFVKNYSDTLQAERIDAEYYQPKYEEIINSIKAYSGGWDTLGNLVTIKKCTEVGSSEYIDHGVPFVRVSNISPFEITKEKYISERLYTEINQHQPHRGEILFSKDATPGIAHYLNEKPEKMIPSGGILRLKIKTDNINNEYLTLVLNSILTKEQVSRDVGGSVILHWRPDQVKNTVIPILPEEIQSEIKAQVIESFSLRKRCNHLLECAKRAVEIAIEQNEETAMGWLHRQTQDNMHDRSKF